MTKHFPLIVLVALCLALDSNLSAETITSASGAIVIERGADGSNQVTAKTPHWQLSGTLPSAAFRAAPLGIECDIPGAVKF
jgi:hypothetical protein